MKAAELDTALMGMCLPADLRALLELAQSEHELSETDYAEATGAASEVAKLMYLGRIATALESLASLAARSEDSRMLK